MHTQPNLPAAFRRPSPGGLGRHAALAHHPLLAEPAAAKPQVPPLIQGSSLSRSAAPVHSERSGPQTLPLLVPNSVRAYAVQHSKGWRKSGKDSAEPECVGPYPVMLKQADLSLAHSPRSNETCGGWASAMKSATSKNAIPPITSAMIDRIVRQIAPI